MCDVVALFFYFNEDGQGCIEFGHFGIDFTEDGDRSVLKFLKQSEVGGGKIGGGFDGVVGEICVHDVVCCVDSSFSVWLCLQKK